MTIRKFVPLFAALALILSAVACDYGPSHAGAEPFLKSFVKTIQHGGEGQFAKFYLQSSDFDTKAEGSEMALNRFTGAVRKNFMRSCATLASVLKGRRITVSKIELNENKPRVVSFLKNVQESYSNVKVHIDTESHPVILLIGEVIRVNKEWRMTTFTVIIDQGSTTLGQETIEIDSPEEEEVKEEEAK